MSDWTIANESCVPCRGGMPKLTEEELRQLLPLVPDWRVSDDGERISRRWAFEDYAGPFAAVQALSTIAERQGHHPDVSFGWGHLEVVLTTHAIRGLHRNDFVVAAMIDRALAT